MAEIIMHIFAIGILHEKVLISLGHRMILRDMGNHMDAFCYLTSLFNLQKPLFIDFWHSVVMLCRFPRLEKNSPLMASGETMTLACRLCSKKYRSSPSWSLCP